MLASLSAINVFLPQGTFTTNLPEQDWPASKPVMALVNIAIMVFLYGGLGLVGLKLSHKLGYPDIWDHEVTNKNRFFTPAITGIIMGLFFIIADLIFSRFHNLGLLPHPPFPTSIIASAVAGIGEEIIFRLFFISFWTWMIAHVILKNRGREIVFWSVAIFSAIAFAVSHIPSVMILYGFDSLGQIPIAMTIEIILLNGVLSIFAAYYFRKYGFLAAVSIHFWVDVVWHVIWGGLK